jgi:hypothetical protein
LPRLGKKVALWFMGSMRNLVGGNLILTFSRWEKEQPLDNGKKPRVTEQKSVVGAPS